MTARTVGGDRGKRNICLHRIVVVVIMAVEVRSVAGSARATITAIDTGVAVAVYAVDSCAVAA